jgi:hypothetical protein
MKQGFLALWAVSFLLTGCGFSLLDTSAHQPTNHIAPPLIGQHPSTTAVPDESKSDFAYSETQIEAIVQTWSQMVVQKFEQIRSQNQTPSDVELCDGAKSETYFRYLTVTGQYEKSLQQSAKCLNGISARSAFYAAKAANSMGRRDLAVQLYQKAVVNPTSAATDKDGAILNWFFIDFDKTILEKSTSWSADKRKLLYNALLITNRMSIENGVSADECIRFLKNEILVADGLYRDVLLGQELFRAMLAHDDSTFEWAGDIFKKTEDPFWWHPAYRLLFATPDPIFKKARIIYDAADPFLHPHSSLPTEDNTYTYDEVYGTACKDTLLQGDDMKSYFDLKSQWRENKISNEDFFAAMHAMDQKNPNRADVMITLAVEAIQQNRLEDARALAWKAHQLCHYYHRSNWMLISLDSARVLRAYPEYADLEKKKKELVAQTGTPAELGQYFLNWSHLTPAVQENMTWSVHLWLKFVPALAGHQFNSYIKFPFELLSEDPGMADVKNQRASYYRDNRNWDDMRGAGGEQMITDYFQAPDAPYGNYNVTSHEMAHQVDSYMEKNMPKSYECLNQIFAQATKRNDFLTEYQRNRPEYFAVGSESIAIPEGYPKRFGADKAWYDQHDPHLKMFIETLSDLGLQNEGQLNCPLDQAMTAN